MWRFAQPFITSGENEWFSKRGGWFFRKINTPETMCTDPVSALCNVSRSGNIICPDIVYHKYFFFYSFFSMLKLRTQFGLYFGWWSCSPLILKNCIDDIWSIKCSIKFTLINFLRYKSFRELAGFLLWFFW